MGTSSTPELRRRLREAAEAELGALLEEHRGAIDGPALAHLFRNPFLTAPMISKLQDDPGLATLYELQRESVAHPRAPRTLALRYVAGLRWADLLRVGLDTRLHPIVRRAADQRLIERLPALAIGERVAIARATSPTVLAKLRNDPTPRVVAALLDNPHTTETLLLPLAASEHAHTTALATVAASSRWVARPALRFALCRNPALPLATALALLPALGKRELLAVCADPKLALPLRRKAGLLGGATPVGGGGVRID